MHQNTRNGVSPYQRIKNWHPDIKLPGTPVHSIDMHTGGEPLRVIWSGAPALTAQNILESRAEMQSRHDHFRTALMWEPRGHADMYGAMILPPERPDSAFGVLFLHNAGYSTMCGHATLALTKLACTLDWIDLAEPETTFFIDAPCGQVKCSAGIHEGQVVSCAFENVPSFAAALDAEVMLTDGTLVRYDLAYGGAFYAVVDSRQFGVSVDPKNAGYFIQKGLEIKQAVKAQSQLITHPFADELSFLYGTIFTEPSSLPEVHSRNVCMFANGEIDRSATGSGVSARAAILLARGDTNVGSAIRIQSIIGTEMTVEIVRTQPYGPHDAIIPKVSGNAWITGQHTFFIDPDDPLKNGFLLK